LEDLPTLGSNPPAIKKVSSPRYTDLKFLGTFSARFSSSTIAS
jgi:hypothetical protein